MQRCCRARNINLSNLLAILTPGVHVHDLHQGIVVQYVLNGVSKTTHLLIMTVVYPPILITFFGI